LRDDLAVNDECPSAFDAASLVPRRLCIRRRLAQTEARATIRG
jgi:hypothetical protein